MVQNYTKRSDKYIDMSVFYIEQSDNTMFSEF